MKPSKEELAAMLRRGDVSAFTKAALAFQTEPHEGAPTSEVGDGSYPKPELTADPSESGQRDVVAPPCDSAELLAIRKRASGHPEGDGDFGADDRHVLLRMVDELRAKLTVGPDPLDGNNPFVGCAVRVLQYEVDRDEIILARGADDARRALGVRSAREWLEHTRARRGDE